MPQAPATVPTAAAPATPTKPKPAVKPKPPAKKPTPKEIVEEVVSERPTVYPTVKTEICIGPDAITEEIARQTLGWETEQERLLRAAAENPGIGKDALKVFEYGDAFMLLDATKLTDKGVPAGAKVRCYHNLDNRPFDLAWCLGLAQSILNGQWAGPLTIPGETVNGSTIVISKTGKVESGQHSMVALVLAHQMWQRNPKLYPFWESSETGPVIETIVITGISEDRRVLMTVDNCKPRSEADVFYTSELFVKLVPADRKECSRMLAAAVDLLWGRTGTKGYKTHSEVVTFVDRHMKLLKCLEHCFVENSSKGGRKINNGIKVTAGQMTALVYLMGASASDGDVYRNGVPPREKDLDWSRFDKAKGFVALLAGGDEMLEVRLALARLNESSVDNLDNQGQGGRLAEKMAVIAKAWDVYAGPNPRPVVAEDVKLSYNHLDDQGNELPPEKVKLLDCADFGGVDMPEAVKIPDPPAPDDAELATSKEDERRKRAEEMTEKLRAMRLGKDAKPVVVKPVTGPSATTPAVAKTPPVLKGGTAK